MPAPIVIINFPPNGGEAPREFFATGVASSDRGSPLKKVEFEWTEKPTGAPDHEVTEQGFERLRRRDPDRLHYRWYFLFEGLVVSTEWYTLKVWPKRIGVGQPDSARFRVKNVHHAFGNPEAADFVSVETAYPTAGEYSPEEGACMTAYGTVFDDHLIRTVRMNDIESISVQQFGTFWTAVFPALGPGKYILNALDSAYDSDTEPGIVIRE